MSDYNGRFVLIDLFGVNCQPCQYQMFILSQIYENYSNASLEIVSIDVWMVQGETVGLIEEFISVYAEHGVYLNWTFGVDDSNGTLLFKYANAGIPQLYLLDKNGNIYYSKSGYTEYPVLSEKIDEMIS